MSNKPLNEYLQRAIKVIKSFGSTLEDVSINELAQLSNTNRKYIQRHKEEIEQYFKIADKPNKAEKRHILNRSLEYHILLAIELESKFIYRNILGAIVGHLLKREYTLLKHIHKAEKIIKIGITIIELISLIYSRKDNTKGMPINAKSKAARHLLDSNKTAFIDELFNRSDGYYAGNKSKKWRLTKLSEQIVEQAIHTMIIMFDDIQYHIQKCLKNSGTYSSKCSQNGETLINTVALNINIIKTFSLRSILNLLSLSVGYSSSTTELIVSMEHTSNTNESLGRSYNVFSRLKSSERSQLSFINYDISSALQTICLQLIQASESDYPTLTKYATNKAFKANLRASIADDLGISINDVKQKLTAFANGGISGKDNHPVYVVFQEESDRLRREVLAYIAQHQPKILEQSIAQSKRNLPENIDWFNVELNDSQALARNKSSVFFFVWTYYERLIRKSMLKCLPDGIEVHDAVYSKIVVDVKVIETAIFECTGFKVIID